MKTKEAVEFIKDRKYALDWWSSYPEKFNQIIDLLQQGEACKQMWEELFGEYGMAPILSDEGSSRLLYKIMQEIEQKYKGG